MIKNILAAVAFGAAAFGAHADTVANGNFETATFGGEYCYGTACGIADWSVAANPNAGAWTGPVLISSTSSAWGNPDAQTNGIVLGNYVLGLQNTSTDIVGGVNSGLSSSFNVVAGQTYELSWDDAGRSGYATHQYDVTVGGVDLGTFTTAGGQGWLAHEVTFTAQNSGVLTFTGLLGGASGYDGTSFIDNVSATAVPEPTSLMLMFVGTLGLVAWRRRAQV
jgi:hypothetical protein